MVTKMADISMKSISIQHRELHGALPTIILISTGRRIGHQSKYSLCGYGISNDYQDNIGMDNSLLGLSQWIIYVIIWIATTLQLTLADQVPAKLESSMDIFR